MTKRDKRIDPTEKVAIVGESGYMQMVSVKGLADKGYRKEEEVQKETLKNLFTSVSSFVNFSVQFLDLDLPVIRLNDLKDIIKNEFGVEADE